jgi:ArsR family transcriptional regulator
MDRLLTLLKVLADETRLKIIGILLSDSLCVGALAKQLGLSEAAVSQHLQILRKNGLVKGEKRGYFTHYIVEKELLYQVAEDIKQLAAQSPQIPACQEEAWDCKHLK